MVYGLAYYLPDITLNIWWTALIVGAILVFINLIIRPIIGVLTLPINLITFGLFSIALNIFFFWFPSAIISGFKVHTIKAALIGAIVTSLVNWLADKIVRD